MSTTPEEASPPVAATTTAAAAAEEEDQEQPSRQEMYRRAMEAPDDDGEPLYVMMSQPTTALIVLSNQMLFKPDGDIIHVIVTAKENLAKCLEEPSVSSLLEVPVADGSLENIHLVVRAIDVDRLFDETAFMKWTHLMQPGGI